MDSTTKEHTGFIASLVMIGFGIFIRLNAREWAWPAQYGFSGPRENTQWAGREAAIGEIGLVLMGIGGLFLVATYLHWLFANKNEITGKMDSTSE